VTGDPPTSLPASLWDPESDAGRETLAQGIHCLPIPTPFAVGRVNVYLLEDEPLTLLDAGPNSGRALDELERGLEALGHRVEDLGLILVSHQHMDHVGLVDILARRSGAEVAALDLLAPWLARYGEFQDADDAFAAAVMARNGIPEETRLALRAVSHAFRGWGAKATVTRPLAQGEQIVLRDRTLTVHHRPGHSPSDTVFHDAARGTLLAADHLIKHISSNPLIARPLDAPLDDADVARGLARPQSLRIYLDSLAATRAMDAVRLVLPGHGQAVTDHVALIDERTRLHARRARRIHRMIAEHPLTAFEIAHAMWGNVAVTQAYLTLSEVLGHVDLLLNDGLVGESAGADGVVRFESLAQPAD
jgi:glyoxylase-like metal-dependent hydrolase (beta-lactamase superfamily II)